MATALIEPCNNVREHQLYILIRLTGSKAVPHPRIELDGLVSACCPLIQGSADIWVGHRVSLAVQDEEWHPYLVKAYIKKFEDDQQLVTSLD